MEEISWSRFSYSRAVLSNSCIWCSVNAGVGSDTWANSASMFELLADPAAKQLCSSPECLRKGDLNERADEQGNSAKYMPTYFEHNGMTSKTSKTSKRCNGRMCSLQSINENSCTNTITWSRARPKHKSYIQLNTDLMLENTLWQHKDQHVNQACSAWPEHVRKLQYITDVDSRSKAHLCAAKTMTTRSQGRLNMQ